MKPSPVLSVWLEIRAWSEIPGQSLGHELLVPNSSHWQTVKPTKTIRQKAHADASVSADNLPSYYIQMLTKNSDYVVIYKEEIRKKNIYKITN